VGRETRDRTIDEPDGGPPSGPRQDPESTRRRRTQRDNGEASSRSRLIDAASKAFAELGYERATIDDIATEAGISRGSVFWHFGSKQALLEAVVDCVMGRLQSLGLEEVDLEASRGLSALEDGFLFHESLASTEPELRRLYHILIGQALGPQSQLAPLIIESRREGRARIAEWLQQAKADGDIPADIDVDVYATVVLAAMAGLIGHWLLERDTIDLDECHAALRRLVLAGLTSLPPERREHKSPAGAPRSSRSRNRGGRRTPSLG
jgi:TetR/AcrR family acrAB operon transcriptional repressor